MSPCDCTARAQSRRAPTPGSSVAVSTRSSAPARRRHAGLRTALPNGRSVPLEQSRSRRGPRCASSAFSSPQFDIAVVRHDRHRQSIKDGVVDASASSVGHVVRSAARARAFLPRLHGEQRALQHVRSVAANRLRGGSSSAFDVPAQRGWTASWSARTYRSWIGRSQRAKLVRSTTPRFLRAASSRAKPRNESSTITALTLRSRRAFAGQPNRSPLAQRVGVARLDRRNAQATGPARRRSACGLDRPATASVRTKRRALPGAPVDAQLPRHQACGHGTFLSAPRRVGASSCAGSSATGAAVRDLEPRARPRTSRAESPRPSR